MRPIRSPIQHRNLTKPGDFGSALNEVLKLFQELQILKQTILSATDDKHKEISQKIENSLTEHKDDLTKTVSDVKKLYSQHMTFTQNVTESVDAKLQELEQALKHVLTIQKGEPGKNAVGLPGKDAEVDYGFLLKEVQKLIPSPVPGKPGKDATIDHEVLADEVFKVIKKKKIKTDHIEGWQDPEILLQRFQARGGVRGGGDTIAAGSNVTISNVNGVKTISSSGGSGFTELTATETPDGSITVFTFAAATAQPSYIVVDNVWQKATSKAGTVNWTWNGGTKKATLTIPATDDIYAIA